MYGSVSRSHQVGRAKSARATSWRIPEAIQFSLRSMKWRVERQKSFFIFCLFSRLIQGEKKRKDKRIRGDLHHRLG